MGKKSTKENKNIYQLFREENGLTREKASELTSGAISDDRIEKIESEKSIPHPDEILLLAGAYKKPELSNYFCSHECPIGQKYVAPIESKDLSQIVLEILASLNTLNKEKDRLIEITADGQVTDNEYNDFIKIKETLDKISTTVDTLQLWIEKTMSE